MDLNAVMNAAASVNGDDDADADMAQQLQQQDQETAEALRSIRQSGSVRSDIARHSDDEDEEENSDGLATESDDDRRRHGAAAATTARSSGGTHSSALKGSIGDAYQGDRVSVGDDVVNTTQGTALLKTSQSSNKRKRSDVSNDKRSNTRSRSNSRSSANAGAHEAHTDSLQNTAIVAPTEPKKRSEHESSSTSSLSNQSTPPSQPARTLRKLSGSTTTITGGTTSGQSPKAVDVKIKDEAVFTIGAGASTANIPAAFHATQAFTSPRDFFVSPTGYGAADTGDGGHVVCTLCQMTIGSRIYSLKRHLYRHHPQVFRITTETETETENADQESKPLIRLDTLDVGDHESGIKLKQEPTGVSLVTFSSSKRKSARSAGGGGGSNDQSPSSLAFEKMNDAFVAWLRSDIIPMKAIESELFHRFLSEINPLFKIPQVVVQPRQHQHKLGASSNLVSAASVLNNNNGNKRFMRGLCLQGNGMGPLLRTDLEIPTPKANEALIKIVRAGICGTDLMMIDNYKPGFKGVIGHEFVGIVQQVGSDSNTEDDAHAEVVQARKREQSSWWIGKRVVGEINVPCDAHECTTCSRAHHQQHQDRPRHHPAQQQQLSKSSKRNGNTERGDDDDGAHEIGPGIANPIVVKRRNHCPNRTAIGIVGKDGVFAEFVTLPLANLHVVPESVVDAHAVFAEPLAAACRILEQQTIQPGDHVAILGDGKLGLLVAEVLHARGNGVNGVGGGANETTLIGKHPEKLALMKHVVTHTLTLDDVTSSNSGHHERFDVCVECTGTPTGMSLALQLLKRGGVLAMKSTCSVKKSPVDLQLVHAKQARVVGSRCGPFDMAMELLKRKQVDVQKFIHGVYPLARAEAALAHAATRGALKIQLVIM